MVLGIFAVNVFRNQTGNQRRLEVGLSVADSGLVPYLFPLTTAGFYFRYVYSECEIPFYT